MFMVSNGVHTAKRAVLRAGLCLMLGGASLFGGNLILTGHDDDYHQSTQARAQALGMIAFARNGSALKVLAFDHSSELTGFLTALGITYDNVDPDAGVPAASLFNHTIYSAIVIASDTTCGGCDNTTTSSANLAAAAGSFAAFVNAGGGIVAFAGASNTSYYSFLPASATNPGTVNCSSCFTQTAGGVAIGVPAVNTDAPHNYFNFPGVGGMAPQWQVAESYTGGSSNGALTNQPFTVYISGAVIGGGGFGGGSTVPISPTTLLLIAVGLASLAALQMRKWRPADRA